MVNYSKHNSSLGSWTGAADARKKVQQDMQTAMQAQQVRQQTEEMQIKQQQQQQEHLAEVTNKSKYILANIPHLRAEVQDVWSSKKDEMRKDIINNHNGDFESWYNKGGYDYIRGLSDSITEVISPELRTQVEAYVDATTNPATRAQVSNTDHQNFEDLKNGVTRNFQFRGLLSTLKTPTAEDKEYAQSMGGDMADAYLNAGNNYHEAKANYLIEYGLPNNEEVPYETLKEYVNQYYQYSTPFTSKGKQITNSGKNYSYSHSINNQFSEMQELTINDIDNIGDNPNYISLTNYLNANSGRTPGITPKGEELSTVVGQGVLEGSENGLFQVVFGQNQYTPPKDKFDKGSGQYTKLPGRITTTTDGQNYYDANGYKLEQGGILGNFIAKGVYIGYEFDTAEDGVRLLTEDNRDEYFGDDSTKTLRPVLIAELVGDVNGTEDNASKFLGFGTKDETTAVYRRIELTGLIGKQFDNKMQIKKDVNSTPTKTMVQKVTNAKNSGDINENIDAMKGIRNYMLASTHSELLKNEDLVSNMDNYVSTINNPLDTQLLKSGIDEISLTSKSALLASAYVDMLNALEIYGEEFEIDGQILDTGSLTLEGIIQSLPNVMSENPAIKTALLSSDIEDYYNIVEKSYAQTDEKTAKANVKMIKKIAKLIESSYLNLYN